MIHALRGGLRNWVTNSRGVTAYGVLLVTAIAVPDTTHAQGRTASLVAVVSDTLGTPLPGAVIWVGMRINAVADDAGRATIRHIPPGEYLVRARHDAHFTASIMLDIGPGATVEVEFDLEPADVIQLPGISVAAERRAPHLVREGYFRRKNQRLGSFVDRDRIEQLGVAGDLCRVFNELRGFTTSSAFGNCAVRSTRGVSSLRNVAAPRGSSSWYSTTSRSCTPAFYVNGSPWDADMVATLAPNHVEAVEGYAGPATTPPRFVGAMTNFCGTIVIWLRR